jgi:hypothetical protein
MANLLNVYRTPTEAFDHPAFHLVSAPGPRNLHDIRDILRGLCETLKTRDPELMFWGHPFDVLMIRALTRHYLTPQDDDELVLQSIHNAVRFCESVKPNQTSSTEIESVFFAVAGGDRTAATALLRKYPSRTLCYHRLLTGLMEVALHQGDLPMCKALLLEKPKGDLDRALSFSVAAKALRTYPELAPFIGDGYMLMDGILETVDTIFSVFETLLTFAPGCKTLHSVLYMKTSDIITRLAGEEHQALLARFLEYAFRTHNSQTLHLVEEITPHVPVFTSDTMAVLLDELAHGLGDGSRTGVDEWALKMERGFLSDLYTIFRHKSNARNVEASLPADWKRLSVSGKDYRRWWLLILEPWQRWHFLKQTWVHAVVHAGHKRHGVYVDPSGLD